jgi:hypothetical protein
MSGRVGSMIANSLVQYVISTKFMVTQHGPDE